MEFISSPDRKRNVIYIPITNLTSMKYYTTKNAVSQNFEDETTIEINEDDFLTDSDFTIEEETDTEDEYKQLPPLEVGKGYTIEHREEDGYINVTNLCKAGNKQFKHWKCLGKTRAFIRVLSSVVGIPTTELIKLGTGSNINQARLGYIRRLLLIYHNGLVQHLMLRYLDGYTR